MSREGLLRLLESGYGLSSHLSSLRRFFLLEHGDFFIQAYRYRIKACVVQ
jgi:hypothetical protein